jgi:UDP-GlcNAc:undecaprenyl-phosphate/decaprenyl-phosphate GlcNAc-1-phosphate transferase
MISLLVAACSGVLAYMLNRILIRFSNKMGSLSEGNKKSDVRWASHAKPLVGGITFFLMFLAGALLLFAATDAQPLAGRADFFVLLLAGTIGFIIGLSDDAYNTTPGLKFLGQLGCGVLLIVFGLGIHLTGIAWLDATLTLFWVVGIMNSFNMMDNMDAASGTFSFGVLIITVLSLYLAGLTGGFYWLLTISLLGTHLGFLYLNWKPSKLYMGDTGSQFLGLLLAFYGIKFFWNTPAIGTADGIRQFMLPILVFLTTIMDTCFVTVARLARRQSPFVGGKDHITHHLVYLGIPEGVVPVILGFVTVLSGAVGIATMYFVPVWNGLYSMLIISYVAVVFLTFGLLYAKAKSLHTRREAQRLASHPELGKANAVPARQLQSA